MPRWDPNAEDRLREAAVELFLDRGYENVTVAEITDRAGLTRRSFSRYFTDKRDVLFAGSEQLPLALAHSVRHADDTLSPFEAVLTALVDAAGPLADQAPLAAKRRAVVQASPELQERGRTKLAAATDAVANALRERGTAASQAALLAEVGVAVFRTAFQRWTDQPEDADLAARIREAAADLAAGLGAVDFAALPHHEAKTARE
ncbi:TetR/AcrR family transcriptional regulator [Actinacidiphila acididurans]|uniref:TetR family transcriptional regulator n=1 Tax=Actinacidiphila acididurans TaxID=2784346 RepID=A0ABS2TMT7_9ACTN|nr:TetR/AcrR family transcriptional regulator [Actinacidiphila acididurans]MBM9503303.1 TetR family transcriptional regulator [Actinacidiphila acididurans]